MPFIDLVTGIISMETQQIKVGFVIIDLFFVSVSIYKPFCQRKKNTSEDTD